VGPRHSGISDIVGAITGDRPGTFDEFEVFGQQRRITRPEDAAALRITYFSEDDIDLGVSQDESIARSLMSGGWGADVDFDDEVAALRDIIGVLGKFQVKAKSILGKVDALSGGDQQKIALARFMSEDCDIMILNEPTRGLDMSSRHDVHKMLSELTESGKSAILLSTDYEDALDWSDRVVVVRDGLVWRNVLSKDCTADQLTLWAREAEKRPRRVWRTTRARPWPRSSRKSRRRRSPGSVPRRKNWTARSWPAPPARSSDRSQDSLSARSNATRALPPNATSRTSSTSSPAPLIASTAASAASSSGQPYHRH